MAINYDKRNFRKHSAKNKELIKKSLKECGAGRSIVIDNEDNIIAGNGIYEQAQELGIKTKVIETDGSELVVVKRTDLATDDEKRKQLAVMDNSTSDSSEFDFNLLQADFDVDDLNNWGIDISDFSIKEEKEIIEDEVPEEIETRCKLGDIWQLGEHRLMCGDSTSVTDVEKLMNGQQADLLLTDPPYGVNIVKAHNVGGGGLTHFKNEKGTVGGSKIVKCTEYRPIVNDDSTETAKKNYLLIKDYSKNQIIFGGNYFTDFLPPSPCWLVWDKQNTGNFADCELAWASFKTAVRIYRFLWNGLCRAGSRKVEGAKRVHPTQKPVGMLADILKDYSKENEIILDCFGGSGSTLIACEQLNRKCYTMELDEHYCDVIIQRWENLTGKKAIKL